ncbi:MAG: hypothetical protein ACE5FT_04635 [Candidatus Nanoarchaeia archaeon]
MVDADKFKIEFGTKYGKKFTFAVVALLITAFVMWVLSLYFQNMVWIRGTSIVLGIALLLAGFAYLLVAKKGKPTEAEAAPEAEPAVEGEKKPCTLTITVLNTEDNSPVANAEVSLDPGWVFGGRRMSTDADGKVLFNTVTGKHKIKIKKEAFMHANPRGGKMGSEKIVCSEEDNTHTSYMKNTAPKGEVKVAIRNFADRTQPVEAEAEFNTGWLLDGQRKPAVDGNATFEAVKGQKYPVKAYKPGWEQVGTDGRRQKYTYVPATGEETPIYMRNMALIGQPPPPDSREEQLELSLIKNTGDQVYAASQELKQWAEGEVSGHPDPRGRLHYCAGLLGGETQLHRRFIITPREYPVMRFGLPQDFRDEMANYIEAVKKVLMQIAKTKESRTLFGILEEYGGQISADGILGFGATKVRSLFGLGEDWGFEYAAEFASTNFWPAAGKTLARTALTPLWNWPVYILSLPCSLYPPLGTGMREWARKPFDSDLLKKPTAVLPRRESAYGRILNFFIYRLGEVPTHTPTTEPIAGVNKLAVDKIKKATEFVQSIDTTRERGAAPVPGSPGEAGEIKALHAIDKAVNEIVAATLQKPKADFHLQLKKVIIHLGKIKVKHEGKIYDVDIGESGLSGAAHKGIGDFFDALYAFTKKASDYKDRAHHLDRVFTIKRTLDRMRVHAEPEGELLHEQNYVLKSIANAQKYLHEAKSKGQKQKEAWTREGAEGEIAEFYEDIKKDFDALQTTEYSASAEALHRIYTNVTMLIDHPLFPAAAEMRAASAEFERLYNKMTASDSPLLNPNVPLTHTNFQVLLAGLIDPEDDPYRIVAPIAAMTLRQRKRFIKLLDEEGSTGGTSTLRDASGNPIPVDWTGKVTGIDYSMRQAVVSLIREFKNDIEKMFNAYEKAYTPLLVLLKQHQGAQRNFIKVRDQFKKRDEFEKKIKALALSLGKLVELEEKFIPEVKKASQHLKGVSDAYSNVLAKSRLVRNPIFTILEEAKQ